MKSVVAAISANPFLCLLVGLILATFIAEALRVARRDRG
jgi:hypothetical protein